jgi:hypothetical protein
LGEVATRDFIRGEVRDILETLKPPSDKPPSDEEPREPAD